MTDSKIIGVFWALLCFAPGVMAHTKGGSYECKPAYSWTVGENVTIKFRIDHNEYPSKCAGTPNGLPFFESSPDGNTAYIPRCQLTDDIQTSCAFISGTPGCGCTKPNDNGFFEIEYNFAATANMDRWWRADIACQLVPSLDPALYFSNIGCLNGINIVTPTMPAPTTPAPEPVVCVIICVWCYWVAIGILIAAVVVLVIIVVLQACGTIELRMKCEERISCGTCCHCWLPSFSCTCHCTCCRSHRLTSSPEQPDPENAELGPTGSPAQKGQLPVNHNSARDSEENQDGEPGGKTGADSSGKKRKQPKDGIHLSTLRSNSSSPDQPSLGRELPVPRNNTAAGPGVSTTITVRKKGFGEPAQLNPAEGQSNLPISKSPRLAPLGSASKITVPSVERNSVGETRKLPLPSIPYQKTQ